MILKEADFPKGEGKWDTFPGIAQGACLVWERGMNTPGCDRNTELHRGKPDVEFSGAY